MAKPAYRELAYQAIGLSPPPTGNNTTDFLLTWQPKDSEAAVVALAAARLKFILHEQKNTSSAKAKDRAAQAIFLTFPEFLKAVRNIQDLKSRYGENELNQRSIELTQHLEKLIQQKIGIELESEEQLKLELDVIYYKPRQMIYNPIAGGQTYDQKTPALKMERAALLAANQLKERISAVNQDIEVTEQALAHLNQCRHPPPHEQKQAAFARIFEAKRHTPDQEGYLAYLEKVDPPLYRFLVKRLPILLPDLACKGHVHITAQDRGGKSELLKALLYPHIQPDVRAGVVLIDPHRDFAEQVARWPEVAQTDRLVYLDPTLDPHRTPVINPLELASPTETDAVHVIAEQLSNVFLELLRSAEHKNGLSETVRALLVPCLSALLQMPDTTLADLQDFMDDSRNQNLVEAATQIGFASHRIFFQKRFYSKQFDAAKAVLYTTLQRITNSSILYRFLIGHSTVNLTDALEAGKIIILNLPKEGLEKDASPIIGCFVLALLQGTAIYRHNKPLDQLTPVYIFVDEYQYFLSSSLKKILPEFCNYGMHLILAQKFYGQEMDPEIALAILRSCKVKICGQSDIHSLRLINKHIDIDLIKLRNLDEHTFFVRISDNHPAIEITTPSNLFGYQHCLGLREWKKIRKAQISRYYRAHNDKKTVKTHWIEVDDHRPPDFLLP